MPRKCLKCESEKDDSQFQYGKATRNTCRECHNNWRREAAKEYKETAETLKKVCTACTQEKLGSEFAYSLNICKRCKSERDKESNNRTTANDPPKICKICEEGQPAIEFRYQSNVCHTCEKERLYEWRKLNPEKFKDICKTYRDKEDYRDKQNKYRRERYEKDLGYKLEILYRNRVRFFIKSGIKNGKEKYEELLGCSWETLRIWLESNFTEGISWENYGTVWHIDHTMPCSIFDFTIEENRRLCFNWSNLAPMLGEENLSKSDKLNMTLVYTMKEKARAFIELHNSDILTERLPEDLRQYSGALATKVSVKTDTGSGEKPEVW